MSETEIAPQNKLPKLKAPDWSKFNLRKLNMITVLGILAYFNILIIFPIIFGRKSPFVQYHVRQGLALDFTFILFMFSFYLPILPYLFALLILICMIIGIINVARGLERSLPIVGRLVK
jgi:uncharacterized membrane protein